MEWFFLKSNLKFVFQISQLRKKIKFCRQRDFWKLRLATNASNKLFPMKQSLTDEEYEEQVFRLLQIDTVSSLVLLHT